MPRTNRRFHGRHRFAEGQTRSKSSPRS